MDSCTNRFVPPIREPISYLQVTKICSRHAKDARNTFRKFLGGGALCVGGWKKSKTPKLENLIFFNSRSLFRSLSLSEKQ